MRPITSCNGYLPIGDHGLIGDGQTTALVGRDGAISWMCVPAFDSPPIFAKLLDTTKGGAFELTLEGLAASRQYYIENTGVLVTVLAGQGGAVEVTDSLLISPGADLRQERVAARSALLRSVRVLHGKVKLRVSIHLQGGEEAEACAKGIALRSTGFPELNLHLLCNRPLSGSDSVWELAEGERAELVLTWGKGDAPGRESLLLAGHEGTIDAWRHWASHLSYGGPKKGLITRSAITLKLLDHFENGAIIAAPTSSLPETLGGVRNWDYRYAWIRDAALSVYALSRIGFHNEAKSFLGWALRAVERHGRPKVLYDVRGNLPPPERLDFSLQGYLNSQPVRWGNGAAHQRQNDVYGEILDCAYQWHHRCESRAIDDSLWTMLAGLANTAKHEWRNPDHGIWEYRTSGRLFTYSVGMCQVTLDRFSRLARARGQEALANEWQEEAHAIQHAILKEAWNEKQQSLTEILGGHCLDASLLALPLRRVLSPKHPKMMATTRAIQSQLGAGSGLLYRYLPEESNDGLPGKEGAFLLCSFWLVDNLALQGHYDEAMQIFEQLSSRVNELGLLPEQIDPSSGAFLGNFPQAFSHVGMIASGVTLGRVANAQHFSTKALDTDESL